MFQRLFLFLLLITHALFSSESHVSKSESSSNTADSAGGPSTMIDFVSVISGQYCEIEPDITVMGPVPLTFERSRKNEDSCGSLMWGWNRNFFDNLTIDKEHKPGHHKHWKVKHYGSHGAILNFTGRKSSQNINTLTLDYIDYYLGVTNCSNGVISGKTNLKNTYMKIDNLNHQCEIIAGDGSRKIFEIDEKGEAYFNREILPNLNQITYESGMKIAKNRNNRWLAWLKVEYPDGRAFWEKYSRIIVKSSDGRSVTYGYGKVSGHKKKDEVQHEDIWALKDVIRSDAPPIHFEHMKERGVEKWLIRKRELPDGRYMGLEYYIHLKDNPVFDIPRVKVNRRGDIRLRRVRRITAPLGTDATPYAKYQFFYEKTKGNSDDVQGSTTVWNAHGQKTIYKHVLKRLTSIEKYDGEKVYSTEKYTWGKYTSNNPKPDYGDLLEYSFLDSTGYPVIRKNYTYDANRNVSNSSVYGNITSEGSEDALVKFSTYSQDGRNLLLRSEDGNKVVELTYYEGTNLVKSKIETGKDGLRRRTFNEFDDSAVLTSEIIDDGTGIEVNDLSGITERRIRRMTLSSVGLPEIVVDSYLDENNQEIVVRKEENVYTVVGRLVYQAVYDGAGKHLYSLSWEYDAMGNVTKEYDATGKCTERSYDANGNRIFEKHESQDFYKLWTYDLMNRPISFQEVHPSYSLSSHMTYDLCGNKTSETDYYGNTTYYSYDIFNREIERRLPAFSTVDNKAFIAIDRKEYDSLGYVKAQIDPIGGRTTYLNNINGQCLSIAYPDGSKESCELNIQGKILSKVDKIGVKSFFQYDSNGNKIYESVNSQTKSSVYSSFHLLSETDPTGLETVYKYDRAGRKIKEICGSLEVNFEHDSVGRINKIISPTEIRETDYDQMSRIVEERFYDHEYSLIKKMGYKYDVNGNKTHIFTYTNEEILVDTKRYNSRGDVVSHINAKGEESITNYYYDHFNDFGQKVGKIEVIDPSGQKLITILDALGRVDSVELRNAYNDICQKKIYRYDGLGNRLQAHELVYNNNKHESTVVNEWHWDSMSRLSAVVEGAHTPEVKITRYEYDIRGLKIGVIKPDGRKIAYKYDLYGRQTHLFSDDVSYEYTYDIMNRPIHVRDLINRTTTTKEYDREHNLIKEQLGNGLTLDFGWDKQGRISKLNLPHIGSINYTYKGALLNSISRNNLKGEELYKAVYNKYDLSGKILEVILPGNIKLEKTYDKLLRPLSIVTREWSEEIGQYSNTGNLLSYHITDLDGDYNRNITYDDIYQISSENGEFDHEYQHDSLYNLVNKDGKLSKFNALNQPQDCDQSFDRNGNLIKDKDRTYFYDSLDRLKEVVFQGKSTKYSYDADNRRLTANQQKFIWQGQDEIGMIENNILRQFRVLGLGLGAEISASVALELDGEVFSPIHDHNGNICALYDSLGNLVSCYRYSAFGESRHIGIQESPWKHSSKRWDEESELFYFGRRYYNPSTHRWISADPIKFDGGANLYAYVLNNPLSYLDQYGLYAGYEGMSQGEYFSMTLNKNPYIKQWGERLDDFCENFKPIPLVKNACERFGKSFYEESFKDLNYIKENLSCTGTLMGENHVPGKFLILTNGIGTTKDEFLKRVQAESKALGGITVHYIYNGTQGVVVDLLECGSQKLGFMMPPDILAKQFINKIFENVGVPMSEVIALWKAHSQGGIITNTCIKGLKTEYAQRIHARTLGTAAFVFDERLASCINYVSSDDYVPYTDYVGYFRSLFTRRENTIFLLPKRREYIDHFYDGETYQDANDQINAEFNMLLWGK